MKWKLSKLSTTRGSAYTNKNAGDLCMIGGIYSNQHCPICGHTFKDDHFRSLKCPNHPEQLATKFEVKIRGISKRFHAYEGAFRFLEVMRYKIQEESFDPRHYRKDRPLGFENLICSWLQIKEQTTRPSYYDHLRCYAFRACSFFENQDVKQIQYADLEDFILAQTGSDKTKHNIVTALHSFWVWILKRRVISQLPEFPKISFEMKRRRTIDKKTQAKIISEVKRISFGLDPKIWLGIKWLATYYNVRPGELSRIKECDMDLRMGIISIPDPKEKRPKFMPLVEEDIKILKKFPITASPVPFFRHVNRPGLIENRPYSRHLFRDWWYKACKNLNIIGVDLYGGTRHSSAIALRKIFSPETIKTGSGHCTSKAFSRYFEYEVEDLREIYRQSLPAKKSERTTGLPKRLSF